MPAMIFDDRVLARVAFQAVGLSKPTDADHALGQAIGALRMLGAVITPWTIRALRDDVATLLANPSKTSQARAIAAGPIPNLEAAV